MPKVLDRPARRRSRDEDELRLVSRLRNLFQYARDEKRKKYDTWLRNYRLLNTRFGGNTAAWMPSPRDSEIYPTLSALVAWMTDQNTKVQLTPAADPNGQFYDLISKKANDLETVYYSTWITEDYDGQIKLALWDELLYGTGILKSVWDNALSGGQGNAMLKRVDPWAWYPDPNATSTDDMEYCCELRRMSLQEIERRWPEAYEMLLAGGGTDEDIDKRPDIHGQSGSPMTGAHQLPNGNISFTRPRQGRSGQPDQLPGYVVYEFWLRENDEWFDEYDELPEEVRPDLAERHVRDRWRVVIMCGNRILMDKFADEIWSHGQHPYERSTFDDIGEFYGIALVDHLAHPQIYINRLLTALQHNAELVGNPIFLDSKSSGLDRTPIINRPGQRLSVNAQALAGGVGAGPRWLEPPQMPEFVRNLVDFWISRIENTSGLSAIVRGATPSSRNAEGVISSIQEAAFVRIRAALRNLEVMLRHLSYKNLDLIVDFYTEPRIMGIVGPDGNNATMALHANHFSVPTLNGTPMPLKYMILVQAGASSPTSRQARVAEADKLGAMGVVDDEYILQAHQVANAHEILNRKYDKMQKGLWAPPGARQRAGRSS
jgi:hypothetical protein